MTQSMTLYKTGDVVLIPFPFTDLSNSKRRPAIILSSTQFNKTHKDVIIAAITSHLPHSRAHEEYKLNMREQTLAGLPIPSVVKVSKIVTLDQSLVQKCLGHVPPSTLTRIGRMFFSIFGGL